MIRRLSLLFLIVLSGVVLLPGPRPAKAQQPLCSNYSFPAAPSGWNIVRGSITGSNILSAYGAFGMGGTSETVIDLYFKGFAGTKYIYSITFTWYQQPAPHISRGVGTTILTAAASGNPGDTNQESDTVISDSFLTWETTQFFYKGLPADEIELTLTNQDFTFITLGMVRICTTDAIPFTSTPSSTPSTTPSPTAGPTSTPTPTGTNTPTPTPSTTPISVGSSTVTPSPTPILSSTLEGGATMAMNGNLFATVEGPHQCADAFNPCGALPFPVPPMATINLPSPTGLPVTPFLTPGSFGTPTGTVTLAPTVLTTDQAALVQFATNAQGAAQEVVVTPGLNGPPGSGPGGLANAANSANQIGATIGDAFGIIRSVQSFFIGKTGAVILFLLLIVLFIVLVRIIVFAIPIIIVFFRLIAQVVAAIRPW